MRSLPLNYQRHLSLTAQQKIRSYNGSEFIESFLVDPSEIIDKILDFGEVIDFKNVNYTRLEILFLISKEHFPNGIGESIKERMVTNTLKLVLHRNRNRWEVTTAFPLESY